jgi:hypothetical protein
MPVLLALGRNDVNLVAVTEQIGNPELAHLADPQAGGIGGHEHGAMPLIELGLFEKLLQFLDAVHLGP